MQYGLSQGHRFAVIGSSDNHDSRPGRSIWGEYPNGLAAFVAKDLTRDSIWDSFWNYQTYATSFERIYMEFTVNGEIVGSEIQSSGDVLLKAYIIGKTDNLSVSLMRDNIEIYSTETTNGLIEFSFSDLPSNGEHYYYLRVSQDNGERAWSTPIWLSQNK